MTSAGARDIAADILSGYDKAWDADAVDERRLLTDCTRRRGAVTFCMHVCLFLRLLFLSMTWMIVAKSGTHFADEMMSFGRARVVFEVFL